MKRATLMALVALSLTLPMPEGAHAQRVLQALPLNDLVLRIERLESAQRQNAQMNTAIAQLSQHLQQMQAELTRLQQVPGGGGGPSTAVLETAVRGVAGNVERLQYEQEKINSLFASLTQQVTAIETDGLSSGLNPTVMGLEEMGARLTALEARSSAPTVTAVPMELGEFRERLANMEAQMRNPPPPAVPAELGEFASRIAALEASIASPATPAAEISALEARLARLETRAPAIPVEVSSLEARISALEARGIPVTNAAPAIPTTLRSIPTRQPTTAFTQPQIIDTPPDLRDIPGYGERRVTVNQAAPSTGAPAITVGEVDGTPTVISPGVGTAPSTLGTIEAQAGITADGGVMDADIEYQNAVRLMEAGSIDTALERFRAITALLPDDPIAGAAHYWIGEAEFGRGDYAAAAQAFLTSFRDFPDGAKAPNSLLRLGMTLGSLGRVEEACEAFSLTPDRYPNAPADVHSRVKIEAQKYQCPG